MIAAAIALAITVGSDTLLARAESLLAAGALPEARRIAERLERARPADPRVLLLLGRVHLAWPVIGRFAAESLFVRAARLAPTDPETHYWAAMAGVALGGDDGESMARPHFEHVLALDPAHRDAFEQWKRLYRDDHARRRVVRALLRHAGDAAADLRRAELLLELRAFDEAMPLLRELARRFPDRAGPHALLAQGLFELGADVEGAAAYDIALTLAWSDADTLLWRQARAIATPLERATWEARPPDPEAFFRLLWARRDPHVATPHNERLGEHFRRAAHARRMYALLHPASRWHRSSLYRALSDVGGLPAGPAAEAVVSGARAQGCTARVPGVRDATFLAGVGAPAPAPRGERTPNLEDGLDDRGRIYVRHGAPTERTVLGLDGETWCYHRAEGVLRVTFLRRTGNAWDASGDMVLTPVLSGESESAARLVATDRPSLAADLRFAFWPATFRSRDDVRQTELLLFPDSLAAAAALLDGRGRLAARDTATARPLALAALPGRYALLLDGDRAGRTGRYRGAIELPDYAGGVLALSGLLVGAGDLPADRDLLAAAAPRGLVLPADAPLRVYAEIYGAAATDALVRYEARYRFERLDRHWLGLGDRARVTTIAFARETPATPRVIESLRVDPARLPRGRYRLQLEIVDLVRGTHATSASLLFELR